ncbi:MAG TPA: mercury methylation corrinoid protein HgcA [Prolixibacteraceae bacterium]
MDFSIDFQSLKPVGYNIPSVATQLNWSDYWGAIKVRWGIGRDHYTVDPGIYKVGKPNRDSDVFVSANYKLSFDALRKNLDSLNAWILVIDTKGINVWCAAGKGTFGTDNLVKSIKKTSLENMVNHRTIIVPQLGAAGVAAHLVKKQSGFRVVYGPVWAKDIKTFVQDRYKATPAMREMKFPMYQRAKLIPVDLMYGKYKLLIVLAALFLLSGLDRTGFLFAKILETSWFPLINIAGAYLAGIVFAPLFLPWIPFRAFALKGAFWGAAITVILNLLFQVSFPENMAMGFINLSIASFMTMNFTGSSTFSSLSVVKKEMKRAIPFQISFAAVGLVLFVISKLV